MLWEQRLVVAEDLPKIRQTIKQRFQTFIMSTKTALIQNALGCCNVAHAVDYRNKIQITFFL